MKANRLLHEYPSATVRLACTKCDRKGQYRKGDLIVKYSASQNLTDMLQLIAKCERHGKHSDWCGAHYVKLAEQSGIELPPGT